MYVYILILVLIAKLRLPVESAAYKNSLKLHKELKKILFRNT
jgi:hypothetical protein